MQAGITEVDTEAELLLELGSVNDPEILPVFVIVPVAPGTTIMVTVALAAFASVPSVHFTVLVPWQVP